MGAVWKKLWRLRTPSKSPNNGAGSKSTMRKHNANQNNTTTAYQKPVLTPQYPFNVRRVFPASNSFLDLRRVLHGHTFATPPAFPSYAAKSPFCILLTICTRKVTV